MESCERQEKEAEQKHKGGRPSKNIKRSSHLMVRLTPTERFLIEGKAKEANMKPSEWFRQAAKRAKVVSRIKPEEMKELRNLSALGNNLNQLVKMAYRNGLYPLAKHCNKLLHQLTEVLKYFANDRENT